MTPPTNPTAPARRSRFGTLFSRTLPAYSGPYPVGVRDVELPIPRQTFGTFKHRSARDDGQVGITLDTVAFTLFYPTEHTTFAPGRFAVWCPRLAQTVDGLLRVTSNRNPIYKYLFYAIVTVFVWGTTLPALKNAPLREPPRPSTPWRLVLFSHAMGCAHRMSSALCGELASCGYVVAAIEHRDGSSPYVQTTDARGRTQDRYWLNWADLEWTGVDGQPADDTTLRRVQLDVRLAEIDAVLRALRRRTQGDQGSSESVSTGPVSSGREWEGGWHAIQLSRPIMAGHSFGGSVAMAAAADRRFDFSHVITFDPAVRRLGAWDDTVPVSLLAVNSEEYATTDEFGRLLAVAPNADTHEIYIMAGATHPSFSDVFLILPDRIHRWFGLRTDAWDVVRQTVDATRRFLEDE